MTVGTDFRQRADQVSVCVKAVVVVDVDEEVRVSRALGRHGRTGQLGYLIGLRDRGEMEDADHAGCHHQGKADQQHDMPSASVDRTQHSVDLIFRTSVHLSPSFSSFFGLMDPSFMLSISDPPSIKPSIKSCRMLRFTNFFSFPVGCRS